MWSYRYLIDCPKGINSTSEWNLTCHLTEMIPRYFSRCEKKYLETPTKTRKTHSKNNNCQKLQLAQGQNHHTWLPVSVQRQHRTKISMTTRTDPIIRNQIKKKVRLTNILIVIETLPRPKTCATPSSQRRQYHYTNQADRQNSIHTNTVTCIKHE